MDYEEFISCLNLCRQIKIVLKKHSSNPGLCSRMYQIHKILYNYLSHDYKPISVFLSADNLTEEFNKQFNTIYNPKSYRRYMKGCDPTPIKL